VQLWQSSVASTWQPEISIILVRYILLTLERHAHYGRVQSDGYIVIGSTGQERPHGLLARIAQIDAELRQLETSIALTPAARARLGLTLAQTGLTMETLRQTMQDAVGRLLLTVEDVDDSEG
jgi:hypothetical protein